jgi:Ca2+-binding RTX toxin-like protein
MPSKPSVTTGTQYDDVFKPQTSTWTWTTGKGGKLTYTTDNADVVYAGSGNDKIDGGAGDDQLYGENGNDLIYGGVGADTIVGGNGDDTGYGGEGADVMWGDSVGNGNTSDNGSDTLYGGAGNDQIHGGNGKDFLYGEADNDSLYGDNGTDWIWGGVGLDGIYGGLGGDVLFGGDKNGPVGDGAQDTFYFTTNTTSSVADSPFKLGAAIAPNYTTMDVWDVVAGFQSGEDKLNLDSLNSWLTNGGPTQLTWRGDQGTDADAATARGDLAHGVWSDASHTFLYADINGDGIADMKIQVNAGFGDLVGVNSAPETDPQ